MVVLWGTCTRLSQQPDASVSHVHVQFMISLSDEVVMRGEADTQCVQQSSTRAQNMLQSDMQQCNAAANRLGFEAMQTTPNTHSHGVLV